MTKDKKSVVLMPRLLYKFICLEYIRGHSEELLAYVVRKKLS